MRKFLRTICVSATRSTAALLLFALMLGVFSALMIGGAILLASGQIVWGLVCFAALVIWSWFAWWRFGFRNRDDFGI
jgi:membrane protein implicated in regulation of membrane protease activity